MPSVDSSATAAILYRLAQVCEVHLGDTRLAEQLRSLAAQEESRPSNAQPPTLAEASALAAAINRYLEAAQMGRNSVEAGSAVGALQEVARQSEMALSTSTRREWARRVAGLYVIIDPELTRGRDVVEVTRAALQGGATAIQLRDKGHDKGDQLPVARRLLDLCQEAGAAFIVNDHADLAAACGAHGLHLGQHDLPFSEARRLLYPTQFVGTSNALLEEAAASAARGADYIAVGAMYPTGSKTNTRPAGLQGLKRARAQVKGIPIVAIGGITLDNVDPVLEAGADGICVIGAVCLADDPEQAARRLVERIRRYRAGATGGPLGSP